MWLFTILKELLDFILHPVKIDEQHPMPDPLPAPVTNLDLDKSPIKEPKKDMLALFCEAIKNFEGQPGDLSYRNNNPGNCRCSPVGYAPQYGHVLCRGGFAVFPTYEQGWQYLLNLVHQRAILHPHWTILDFFNNYSPTEDNNNPTNYAHTVAVKCGVLPTITLKELFA